MDLIEQSLKRILSDRISPQLWLALVLVQVFGFSAILLTIDDVFGEPGPLLFGGLAIMLIVTTGLLFVTSWKMVRALGDATADDPGGVGPWIGWTIVAFLPVSIVYGLLEYGDAIGSNWLLSAILLSVGLALMAPLLVRADGKAIQVEGPSFSEILQYWAKNYIRLFGAYLAISLPILIASDGLAAIKSTNLAVTIGLSIASAAVAFVSTLICAGITVSAYREAEGAAKR